MEALACRKRRTLVLNKSDLANASIAPAVSAYMASRDGGQHPPLFTSCSPGRPGRAGRALLEDLTSRLRAECPHADALLVMVVGVPNCGKSSLVNSLRLAAGLTESRQATGAAAGVGPTPGLTRRVSSFRLLHSPPTHVLDTPGIMVPRIDSVGRGLRLALTGAIRDSIVGEERLARFLIRTLAGGLPVLGREAGPGAAMAGRILTPEDCDGALGPQPPLAADADIFDWSEVEDNDSWAAVRDLALQHPALCALPRYRRLVMQLGMPAEPIEDSAATARVNAAHTLLAMFRGGQLGNMTLDRIPRVVK